MKKSNSELSVILANVVIDHFNVEREIDILQQVGLTKKELELEIYKTISNDRATSYLEQDFLNRYIALFITHYENQI